jgi:AcrR family transcriptional regulator
MVRNSNERSPADGAARIRRRAEARRLSILRSAGRVFRRQGFAATGMRDIAAEAGLSPGNLYHYFRGKHELLFFCQDRALDQMLATLEAARLSSAPAIDRLAGVLRAHARCLLDELEGSAAHLEVDALPPELRGRIVSKRDRYERGIRRLVASGVRGGEFAPCDATLVTRAILGALNWTAGWFRPDGPKSASAVADELADYLVRGVVAPRRRAGRRAGTGGTP